MLLWPPPTLSKGHPPQMHLFLNQPADIHLEHAADAIIRRLADASLESGHHDDARYAYWDGFYTLFGSKFWRHDDELVVAEALLARFAEAYVEERTGFQPASLHLIPGDA